MKDRLDRCTNLKCRCIPERFFVHKQNHEIRGYCLVHFKANWPTSMVGYLERLWYIVTRDEAVVFVVHSS